MFLQFSGRKKMDANMPNCWVGVKVFGNELSMFTCEDLYNQINQVSLSMAGLAVRLLKVGPLLSCVITVCYRRLFTSRYRPDCLFHSNLQGHEVQLNHRSTLMAEELAFPSLSGLPIKLGVNMTSLLSLHLKGRVNYRDYSHFSLNGYIKPKYLNVTQCHMGSSFFTVWFFLVVCFLVCQVKLVCLFSVPM